MILVRDIGEPDRDALQLIATRPVLRRTFVHAPGSMEDPLTSAITERIGGDESTARVLAASVAAAVRIALERWLQPTTADAAESSRNSDQPSG
ncbi:MAG TPA: hypothetical protein VHC49_05720 [Mycobacteriales bacterium]|nr:hypothetical protein [Mycobacteriales bacterium]